MIARIQTVAYDAQAPDGGVCGERGVETAVAPAALFGDGDLGLDGPGRRRLAPVVIVVTGGGLGERDPALKPILTVGEAALLLGVSPKRMANLISEERRRLGREPGFVCSAGGRMRTRVARDELLAWAKAGARRRGRPPKRTG